MTWGAQYMYYDCENCGEKFKYAIDLIPEFGDDFGKCPCCGKPGKLVGEGPVLAKYNAYKEVE